MAMTAGDKPDVAKSVAKLAGELVTYQAKKFLGERFLATAAGDLTEFLGDELSAAVSDFLDQGGYSSRLVAAFEIADRCFQNGCRDSAVKQWAASLPLRRLDALEQLARKLPQTLDADGLQLAIRQQMQADWRGLTEAQYDQAAGDYLNCLSPVLAAKCDQLGLWTYLEARATHREVRALAASVGEIKTAVLGVAELGGDDRYLIQTWAKVLGEFQRQLLRDIHSAVGNKYLPGLYVHRDVELRMEAYFNKSITDRQALIAALRKLSDQIVSMTESLNHIASALFEESKSVSKRLKSALEVKSRSKSLEAEADWKYLNSLIDLLNPANPNTSFLRKRLDHLGAELDLFRNVIVHQGLSDEARDKALATIDAKFRGLFPNILEQLKRQKTELTLRNELDRVDTAISQTHTAQEAMSTMLAANDRLGLVFSRGSEKQQIAEIEDDISELKRQRALVVDYVNLFDQFIQSTASSGPSKSVLRLQFDELAKLASTAAIDDTVGCVRRLQKNCLVVVDRAGSGKTNTLCQLGLDLVLTRPVIFISGKLHLKDEFGVAEVIERTIARVADLQLKGNSDWIWSQLGHRTEGTASTSPQDRVGRTMVVMIDGINENSNGPLMKKAIHRVLNDYSDRDVLFCASCRDIYWSYFDDAFWFNYLYDLVKGGLYTYSRGEYAEAMSKYLGYYEIDIEFAGDARSKISQPLLLRFFCETYSNPNGSRVSLGTLTDIRYRKLFDDYWDRKVTNARQALAYRTDRVIEEFLYDLAQYIRRNKVRAVPLLEIPKITNVSDLESANSIYVRTLDEDVILEQGLGETNQVIVTFVYDEFMEYTMAREIMERSVRPYDAQTGLSNIVTALDQSAGFGNMFGVVGYLGTMLEPSDRMQFWQMVLGRGNEWLLPSCRGLAKLSLDDWDADMLTVLAKLAFSDQVNVQREVLAIAERLPSSRSLPHLMQVWTLLFRSSDPTTRIRSRDVLVQLANEGQSFGLIQLQGALRDATAVVRACAIYGLNKVAGFNREILLDLSNDVDPFVREAVAIAFARCRSSRCAHALVAMLNDDAISVRLEACRSLAHYGSSEYIPRLLTTRANDADRGVRHQADISIKRICVKLDMATKRRAQDELRTIRDLELLERKESYVVDYYWDGDDVLILANDRKGTLEQPFSADTQILWSYDDEPGLFSIIEALEPDYSVYEDDFYDLLKEQIQNALSILTDREREVLEFRYGLKDGVEHTRAEVATMFRVTPSRISHIEAKAVKKLRHPTRSRAIRDYLG